MASRQPMQRTQPEREPAEHSAGAANPPPLGPDFISLMHKVVQQSGAQAEQPRSGKPRRDYETAFGLLDQASNALDTLLQRCQQLEAQVEQVSERARAEAEAAEGVRAQWQKLAAAMKAQVEEHEKRLAGMKQRVDAAEARAEAVQARAAAAEQAASEKEDLSTRFHDKVVTAFGIGSRAHGVLEAVAKGALPEAHAGNAAAG